MLFRRPALLPVLLLIAAGGAGWILLGMGSVARAQSGFELQDGDRVLFYGDSITDRGEYTTFVEDYVLTRFPRRKIRFLNAGWAGDRVSGGVGGPIDARLARGVNLALLPTPMARQAAEVHELTLRHQEIHFVRWRQVQVPLQARRLRALAPALRALDALEDELIRQQRAAAQPRPHQYELAPESRVKPRDLPVRGARSARL